MKQLILCLIALAGLWYAGSSNARIQSEVRCSTYTITSGGYSWTGGYCWIEYSLVRGTPSRWDPPQFPDLPGGSPPANNPAMCQDVLDNWPDGCSEEKAPFVMPDGCSWSPDNAGPVGFTPACNAHDVCYGTFGTSKASCDGSLGDDLRGGCTGYYRNAMRGTEDEEFFQLQQAKEACKETANTYENVVSAFPAWAFYDDGQDLGECIEAHDDRDQYCGP